MRSPKALLCSLALAALPLASCTSPTYVAYEFRPRPLTVDVQGPGDSGIVARAVVSVLGIVADTERDPKGHLVQVRMHLENLAREPISLDEPRWLLLSADVREFDPPRIPVPPAELAPQGQATVDLFFPVPAGHDIATYDLSNLNLRFGVNYQNATIVVSATFERWEIDPYPHYYYGPYSPYYYGPYAAYYPGTEVRTTIGVGIGF